MSAELLVGNRKLVSWRNKLVTFDTVLAHIGQHGLVKRRSLSAGVRASTVETSLRVRHVSGSCSPSAEHQRGPWIRLR